MKIKSVIKDKDLTSCTSGTVRNISIEASTVRTEEEYVMSPPNHTLASLRILKLFCYYELLTEA